MINCPTLNNLQQITTADLPPLPRQALHLIIDDSAFITAEQTSLLTTKIQTTPISTLLISPADPTLTLFSLTCAGPDRRERTLRQFADLIRWAATLPTQTTIIIPTPQTVSDHPIEPQNMGSEAPGFMPGVASPPSPLSPWPMPNYEDTFNHAFFAISKLAAQAADLSVDLAIENPSRHLLLSPLELRDFIDQTNSSSLSVCFNPCNAAALCPPADWLTILDRRVTILRLTPTTPPPIPNPPNFPDSLIKPLIVI